MKISKLNSSAVIKDMLYHVNQVLKKIKKNIDLLDKGVLTFHYGGRPVRAQKIDLVRILSQIRFDHEVQVGIRNIIIEGVMTGEGQAIGSGYLALKMLLSNKKLSFTNVKTRVEKKEIEMCVSEMMRMGLSRNIIDTIISSASIDSDVILDTSEMASQPVLRVQSSILVPSFLHEIFSSKRKSLQDAGLIIIDGTIESLGELESLLSSFSEEKKSLVIIARGYLPDVVATLHKNYILGNLHVFPFVIHGENDVLDDFRKIDHFYDVHNIMAIRSLKASDFTFDRTFYFKQHGLEVTGINSTRRRVFMTLPSYFKSLLGLLDDRISMGIKLCKDTARSGIADCDHNDLGHFSRLSAENSIRIYKSLLSNIKNLDCAVLQEQ